MEPSHKPQTPRAFDTMPRSEDQIRDTLREQLETMWKRWPWWIEHASGG